MAVAIALVNSIGNLGGFFGPNVIGLLMNLAGGTQGAFTCMSLVGIAAAALCLVMQRQPGLRTVPFR